MARRSVLDDLTEITTQLPWRVGLALAAVSGVALHLLAMNPNAPVPRVTDLTALGAFANDRLIGVFAWFLQFLVPTCLLMGALASYLRRRAVRSDPWRHVVHQRLRYQRLR